MEGSGPAVMLEKCHGECWSLLPDGITRIFDKQCNAMCILLLRKVRPPVCRPSVVCISDSAMHERSVYT